MASTGLTNNRSALVYTVGAQVHGSRIEVIPGDYYGNNVHLSNRCSLKTRGNGDNSSVFVLSLSTACARRLFFPFYLCLAFLFLFPPLSSKPFWYFICEPNCLYSLSFSASLCHPPARSCSLPLPLSIFSSIYRSGS